MIKILLLLVIYGSTKNDNIVGYCASMCCGVLALDEFDISCGMGKWYGWPGIEVDLGGKKLYRISFCQIGYGMSFGYMRYTSNGLVASCFLIKSACILRKECISNISVGSEGTMEFYISRDFSVGPSFAEMFAGYKFFLAFGFGNVSFDLWYKPWMWNFKDYNCFGVRVSIIKSS